MSILHIIDTYICTYNHIYTDTYIRIIIYIYIQIHIYTYNHICIIIYIMYIAHNSRNERASNPATSTCGKRKSAMHFVTIFTGAGPNRQGSKASSSASVDGRSLGAISSLLRGRLAEDIAGRK